MGFDPSHKNHHHHLSLKRNLFRFDENDALLFITSDAIVLFIFGVFVLAIVFSWFMSFLVGSSTFSSFTTILMLMCFKYGGSSVQPKKTFICLLVGHPKTHTQPNVNDNRPNNHSFISYIIHQDYRGFQTGCLVAFHHHHHYHCLQCFFFFFKKRSK